MSTFPKELKVKQSTICPRLKVLAAMLLYVLALLPNNDKIQL